jgi:hypothetical protein
VGDLWTDYRQILVHYYTGIDILQGEGGGIHPHKDGSHLHKKLLTDPDGTDTHEDLHTHPDRTYANADENAYANINGGRLKESTEGVQLVHFHP